jgi:hypothetical protein
MNNEEIMQKRREKFEMWADENGFNILKPEMWVCWQAALDSVVVELPKTCAYESLDGHAVFVCLTYDIHERARDPVELIRKPDVIKSLNSVGIKTK